MYDIKMIFTHQKISPVQICYNYYVVLEGKNCFFSLTETIETIFGIS